MPKSTNTSVAFLQWGPLHEPDESHAANNALRHSLKDEGREDRTPYVTNLRVTEPDSATFLSALQWTLEAHPNLQVLYLSAHGLQGAAGTSDSICFDTSGQQPVTYKCVGGVLSTAFALTGARPVVIFGACYALAHTTQVHLEMPRQVLEIAGFTHTPSPQNVAELIAGVLKSDEEILQSVTAAAAVAGNTGQSVAAAAEQAADSHMSRLQRFITKGSGIEIRHMCQDDHGAWTGYTIKVP
jgi:hypothetical protein